MAESMVFPALLKYWRGVRGMSQLDLALAADVSTRHLSFLETGRSKPSQEMVLRLSATLGIPMREQNALLAASGFDKVFGSAEPGSSLDPVLDQALSRMMTQQEPYPLTVMDRHYNLISGNQASTRLFAKILGDRAAGIAALGPPNILRLTFSPLGFRPDIVNWESLARQLLIRLQREVLQNPADRRLAELLDELVGSPGLPDDWQTPDFGLASVPTLNLRFRCAGEEIAFLTTLTIFNAPQNVMLEELHIESYFPLDEVSERVCRELAD